MDHLKGLEICHCSLTKSPKEHLQGPQKAKKKMALSFLTDGYVREIQMKLAECIILIYVTGLHSNSPIRLLLDCLIRPFDPQQTQIAFLWFDK